MPDIEQIIVHPNVGFDSGASAATKINAVIVKVNTLAAAAGTGNQLQFVIDGTPKLFGADVNLVWDNTDKRLAVGNVTPLATVHIKGVGATSATEALRVTNSANALALQIFNDRNSVFGGKVTATEFEILNRGSIVGGSFPRIQLGYNTTFATGASFGIQVADGSNFVVSTGSQYTFAFGRYLNFATGGGNYNAFYMGTGLDSSNRVNLLHNHIMFGCNSNLPTLIITPATGLNTTGGASLGLQKGYNTSTWSVKGQISGIDPSNDKVSGVNVNVTRVDIRRPDGLAIGTFQYRVTPGTLIEVASVKSFVIGQVGTGASIDVTRPIGNGTLLPITVFPSIVTWLKQDLSFAANINYYGNLVIGTNADNDESTLLQLNSTTKGFLPPRMTGAQVEAIASPAEGLMVYATNAGVGDINAKGWWGFNGTNWEKLNN